MFVSFTDQRPVLIDSFGNPLSYGEVTFCDQGTTTPKTIYSDEARTIALTNPQIMDISGRPVDQIFLGIGDYTCFVKRFIGADILTAIPADWTDDNQFDMSGLSSPLALATTATVDTIADLKNIDSAVYQSVTVLGYFAKGDCPARVFIWSATESGAENLGTIVSSSLSVSGRWMYQPISVIDIRTFGAVPGGINCNGAITNAEAWANSLTNHSVTIYFPKGVYSVSGTVTQPMRVPIAIDKGVTFLNTVAGNYKLDIQSSYQIDLDTALQSVSSIGSAGLRFSGIREGVVKFEWLGQNEVGFGRFIADVASSYVLRVNELADASLVTSGGTKQCRLSFGPLGAFLLDGSGYEIRPYSIINENTDGCIYFVEAGKLDLRLLSSVNTSWFRTAIDASQIFDGSMQQVAGTVLNVDGDCSITTAVTTDTNWTLNAQGGIITLTERLTCGVIQAGDIGLFKGPSYVTHIGTTNLCWFIFANPDKDEALDSAIVSARASSAETLDGRGVAQTYTDTHYPNGNMTIKNLNSTNAKFTVSDSLILSNCTILSDTFALYSSDGAGISIENCLIYGSLVAIQTNGSTRISDSTVNGVCIFDGPIDADHSRFGAGSVSTYMNCSDITQITNCQIKNPIVSKDKSGAFGQTLISNNLFIGVGTTKPNWTLQASTIGSLSSAIIFNDNIFTGTYATSTDSCIASVTGAGTFALLQKILISNNKATSANVVIKSSKGSAIGSYSFAHVGSGMTVGTVDLNLSPVFVIPSYVLNESYDLALVQQHRSSVGISTANGTSYLLDVVGLGYVSGASPVTAYINFDLYR